MRHDLTATDREALPGILAAVLEWPGTTNDELQSMLSHPEYRVRKVLSALRRQGLVGLVRTSSTVARWYPPAEAVVIRAKIEREARRKRKESNRLYNARMRAGLLDDGPDDWFKHLHGDAHAPLPFVCVAPPSVFHLGAAA